jgi:hypothetical protein
MLEIYKKALPPKVVTTKKKISGKSLSPLRWEEGPVNKFKKLLLSSAWIEQATVTNQFFYRESPLPIGSPALNFKYIVSNVGNRRVPGLALNYFFLFIINI